MVTTIKDVAKKAGVSISTVSRVINDSKPVSKEVKRRVLEAVEELGYKPNEIARTLVTKKSFLIGVIVTDLGNSYIAEIVRGIEEVGKMYNYDILLCSTFGDKEAELRYMQILTTKQVEGIIMLSRQVNEDIDKYTKGSDTPFVYLNRYYYDSRYPTIMVGNYRASFDMTDYLIGSKHKKIVYISNSRDEDSLEKLKIDGYRKAISQAGLEEKVYFTDGVDMESGYSIAKDIISDQGDIDAIFCGYDEIAIGVLGYLYDSGIRVPEDISVTGFGDIRTASIYRPKLTTIGVPYYDIGAVSIRRVIKQLKGEKLDGDRIELPYRLEIRESSKKY